MREIVSQSLDTRILENLCPATLDAIHILQALRHHVFVRRRCLRSTVHRTLRRQTRKQLSRMAIHDIKSFFKRIAGSGCREMRNLDDQALRVSLLLDSYGFDSEIGCSYRRVDAVECNRVDRSTQQLMVILVTDISYPAAQYHMKINRAVSCVE